MAINIKELFTTDLNPNSNVWWSKDKVDKINYNFYLLSNGGMPGPQGTIGEDGAFGVMGTIGTVGAQGPQGYQGPQGKENLNDWIYFPESDVTISDSSVVTVPAYLFPRRNLPTEVTTAPVNLRIGFLSTDPEYVVPVEAVSPVQIINTENTWTQLRVLNNNLTTKGYNFNFSYASPTSTFKISPGVTSAIHNLIFSADNISLSVKNPILTGFTEAISITDSIININKVSPGFEFNLSNVAAKKTSSSGQFRYSVGAGIEKILTSTDIVGNVAWKTTKEIFQGFPIGSILSIRESDFNSSYFTLSTSSTNPSIPVGANGLSNTYGRGIVGDEYEGWYLCNGQTWRTEQGSNAYLTPNLNNFTYNIQPGGSQPVAGVNLGQNDPILIGGYDLRILASTDQSGVYNIQYTSPFPDNDQSPSISLVEIEETSSAATHYSSRMVHIVYLKEPNLIWSSTAIPQLVLTSITLTVAQSSSNTACTAPVDTIFSWTGENASEWATVTPPTSDYQLYAQNSSGPVLAPSGWYANDARVRLYWNGTSFTNRIEVCQPVVTNNKRLAYSTLISWDPHSEDRSQIFTIQEYDVDLNVPRSSLYDLTTDYFDYDTPLFQNATTITWFNPFNSGLPNTSPGDLAPKGWYRDPITGVRRYWNGTEFRGIYFTKDYVTRISFGGVNWGENPWFAIDSPGYTPCTTPVDYQLAYIETDNYVVDINTTSTTYSNHIFNQGSPLYVAKDWNYSGVFQYSSGTVVTANSSSSDMLYVIRTPELINIKDQTAPNSNMYYKYIYMQLAGSSTVSGRYGILSTPNASGATGKISQIALCNYVGFGNLNQVFSNG